MRRLEAAIDLHQALECGEPGGALATAKVQPGFVGDDGTIIRIELTRAADGCERLLVVAMCIERGRIPVQRLGRARIELQGGVEVLERCGRIAVPPPGHESL